METRHEQPIPFEVVKSLYIVEVEARIAVARVLAEAQQQFKDVMSKYHVAPKEWDFSLAREGVMVKR